MSVPLAEARGPSRWVVDRVRAGGGLGRELAALGLVRGTELRILQRSRTHLLIAVDDARYSLGDEIAREVLVRRKG